MVPACRASAALLLALAACGGAAPRERIVLVTLDTLRHDVLERADGESDMPLLRGRSGTGTLFDRAFAAASTTQPTHATLLTGRHPWEHGVTRNGIVLEDEERTLAEVLGEHGFESHAVVAAYPLHRRFGFAQGFDSFHDDFHEAYVLRWEGAAIEGERFYSLADAVTDEALRALEGARGPRQFFWFHYFDAHDPYGDDVHTDGGGPLRIERLLALAAAHDPALDGTLARARELYARDVRGLDRSLERLLAALEADEDVITHVIVTADHGESFGELGCLGHGMRLVAEQLHVPLWIESPRLPPGRRDDPVGSIDVARTILALAGVEPESAVGGVDLVAERSQGAVGMRRTFAAAKTEQLTDGSRIALAPRAFFAVREGQLYTGDRTRMLFDDDPARPAGGETASALAALFGRFEERLEDTSARELADPEIQDALQKLGYTR
jgi:choline-sulfatase